MATTSTDADYTYGPITINFTLYYSWGKSGIIKSVAAVYNPTTKTISWTVIAKDNSSSAFWHYYDIGIALRTKLIGDPIGNVVKITDLSTGKSGEYTYTKTVYAASDGAATKFYTNSTISTKPGGLVEYDFTTEFKGNSVADLLKLSTPTSDQTQSLITLETRSHRKADASNYKDTDFGNVEISTLQITADGEQIIESASTVESESNSTSTSIVISESGSTSTVKSESISTSESVSSSLGESILSSESGSTSLSESLSSSESASTSLSESISSSESVSTSLSESISSSQSVSTSLSESISSSESILTSLSESISSSQSVSTSLSESISSSESILTSLSESISSSQSGLTSLS